MINIFQGVYYDEASLEEVVFEAQRVGCQVSIGALSQPLLAPVFIGICFQLIIRVVRLLGTA